jgi:putative SOS response-associated peptidase YedK
MPPATDEWIESCCIVTCEPNELTEKFRDRMPVILDDANYDTWLTGTPEQALELLRPYPADEMRAYPVSKQVNSSRDDVSQMVEALDEAPEIASHRPGEGDE